MSRKDKEQVSIEGTMSEDKEVSAKSTKNEIYEAYQQLLGQLKDTKQVSHQDVTRRQEEVKTVAKATEYTPDRIITHIAEVKTFIGNSLEQLELRLVPEYRRLHELQDAIRLESAHLENLHQIKAQADSLAALLLAQKEYKARFEQGKEHELQSFEELMATKKAAWKKEQESAELERKERNSLYQKEQARTEEEYQYNIQLERKKDHDAYQLKKLALEHELHEKKTKTLQELAEREKSVAASEVELATLREQVGDFQKRLEKAIVDTELRVREEVERDYRHRSELAGKETEGEQKLNRQIISNLQAKIKEQESHIIQLTQKLNDAGLQVQAMALKALDNSVMRYAVPTYDDAKKGSQQERGA